MAHITGVSEEVKGQQFEITDEGLTIGRVDENKVVIQNDTVSSRHCMIARRDRQFTLLDLDSTNGTRVNSQDIREQNLQPKDIIQVGSVEFVFDAGEDEVDPVQEEVKTVLTEVHEETGSAAPPESFDSISPFGAPKKGKGLWPAILTLVTLVAVSVLGYLLYVLITAE